MKVKRFVLKSGNSLGVSNAFIILAADTIGISYIKLRKYLEKFATYNIYVTDFDDFADYMEATRNLHIS